MALLNFYFQGVCVIYLLRVCSGLSLVELVFGLKLGSERPRSYDVVEYDAVSTYNQKQSNTNLGASFQNSDYKEIVNI